MPFCSSAEDFISCCIFSLVDPLVVCFQTYDCNSDNALAGLIREIRCICPRLSIA